MQAAVHLTGSDMALPAIVLGLVPTIHVRLLDGKRVAVRVKLGA
jgi:hypothetical protein